jgi:hypothetical protein
VLLPRAARAQHLDGLGPQAGPFRAALILAQLKENEFVVDSCDAALWANGRYRAPYFDLLYANPWKISPYVHSLADRLLTQATDPTDILFEAEGRAGCQVGNAVLGDPLTAYRQRVRVHGDSALAVALSELDGRPVSFFRGASDYRLIPPAVRDAAALILFQIPDALRDRERALTGPLKRLGLDPQQAWQRLHDWAYARAGEAPREDGKRARGSAEEPLPIADLPRVTEIEAILDAVDVAALYHGANLLAAGMKQASADLQAARLRLPPRDFHFAVSTPYGWVKILGTGQHHHREDERHLLIIDVGGDDVYASAANTLDYGNPISLVLDVAGNDEYRTDLENQPAFGVGICGYGMLLDLGGDDLYSSPVAGQGCGILGVGLLHDVGGSDRYRGDSALQGCGIFGVGALVDLAGNDQYACYRASQGFGFTRGCGVLLDVGGDDTYAANDEEIRYPASPGPSHQWNMAQGFGCGRRGEAIDGHNWAGGVGILVDGAGNDTYTCGTYGIGGAYGLGVGLLADRSGNDTYTCYASAIASALHGGIGVVQDEAGDDLYRSGSTRACGFGGDFGVAWFEDGSGNDRYYCNDSALGVGHQNGLGVCWDRGGNDIYVACNNSFGISTMETQGTVRDLIANVGFFVDVGGADRYYQLPLEERENLPFHFRTLALFAPFEGLGDGVNLSRYDLLRQPGSTGAAVDAE